MVSAKERFGGGVAVITGAGSGIGEGLAHVCAGLGMSVVLADIAEDRLFRVADQVAGSTMMQTLAIPTDVTDPAAVDRLAQRAYDEFGPVRLLVNNAGIETTGLLWEMSVERWNHIMAVNVNGAFHGIQSFVPRMIKAGQPANIVSIASIAALTTMPMQAPYIVSKHAVQSLSECLYLEVELVGAPITVSTVLPGPVQTRIFADAEAAGRANADKHRRAMDDYITNDGIAPRRAAEIIVEGAAAGNFWIHTHPETSAAFAQRRAELLTREPHPIFRNSPGLKD